MKRISDVIKELEQFREKHGDLPVLVYDEWNEFNIGLIRHEPKACPWPVSPRDENEFEREEENRHSESVIIYSRDTPESKFSEKEDESSAEKEETLHIRLNLRPKIKTFNGILTLKDHPVDDSPGADYNPDVLFLHNEPEPLANLVSEFAGGSPIKLYYHITTEQTEETERLLREIGGGVDARVESILAYPQDDHWIHHNRFKIGDHNLNYIFGHSLGKWIFIKLIKY